MWPPLAWIPSFRAFSSEAERGFLVSLTSSSKIYMLLEENCANSTNSLAGKNWTGPPPPPSEVTRVKTNKKRANHYFQMLSLAYNLSGYFAIASRSQVNSQPHRFILGEWIFIKYHYVVFPFIRRDLLSRQQISSSTLSLHTVLL